jgi:protoporphyrinogen oxidase
MSKVAIIGAGYTGLSAATKLIKNGFEVDIFESRELAGGLASGIKYDDFDWAIEPLYHHWFLNESAIIELAKAHGLINQIKIFSPNTSFFLDGKIKPFDRPHHVLMYPGLSIIDRYRLATKLATLRISKNWKYYEKFTAEEWLIKNMGENVYEKIWKPMLVAKWSGYYDKVNMAWFWARIYVRTQKLMYPEGGFQYFNNKIVESLKASGVKFKFSTKINLIKESSNGLVRLFDDKNKIKTYSKVLITTGPKSVKKLINNSKSEFSKKLSEQKSMGAICVLFILKKPFLKNTYWLNIPAKTKKIINNKIPFLVCIDHTAMVPKKYYGGKTIVYCANYVNEDSDLLKFNDSDILNLYKKGICEINANFNSRDIVKAIVTKANYASPVFFKNHSERVPTFDTSIKNVFWASMSHVYPWDRGTNYASDIGFSVADYILKGHD